MLSPLFKLLEALVQLVTPLVVATIVDVGVATGNSTCILQQTALLLVLAVAGFGFATLAQYYAAVLGAGFGTTLRDELFAHILSLSQADIDKVGTATLVTRMTNDTQQIQDGMNRFFRLVLRSPFIVFGSMLCAFLIDGRQGLIFVVTIAILFVVVFAVMYIAIRGFTQAQTLLDLVAKRTGENLAGVRSIRAYRREQVEMQGCHSEAENLRVRQLSVGRISALTNPATYVVVNLALVAILATGAVQVDCGELMQGQVVALINYVSQILVELVKMADLIVLMSRASACAQRVNAIFAMKSSMPDGSLDAAAADGSVEFRDVTFTYPCGGTPALEHVSFRVAPGGTLGVIGGTGSGKSTLAALVCRSYDASSGEVLLGKANISTYTLSSLHAAIGVVEQRVRLFSGTIASNLAWGSPSLSDDELASAIATAQATDVIEAHGGVLSAAVEERGSNFSGGQRQRLSIARAFSSCPKVLVLDDASSALDFATEAKLRHALASDLPHTTKLIISQRVSAIRHADCIVVLDGGRQVGCGTHEELIESCEIYQQICLSQLPREEVMTG